MHYKLSEKIYWGDWESVLELKDKIGSIICLVSKAGNGRVGYNPLDLNYKIRYFRMAENDRSSPEDKYYISITEIIKICLVYSPLLIHCYAGMHRSPSIALMAELINSNNTIENYNKILSKIEKLNPSFIGTSKYDFRLSTQNWIKNNILKNE